MNQITSHDIRFFKRHQRVGLQTLRNSSNHKLHLTVTMINIKIIDYPNENKHAVRWDMNNIQLLL